MQHSAAQKLPAEHEHHIGRFTVH